MNRLLVIMLLLVPFLCTGDVGRAETKACKSTNFGDLALEKDCVLPVGTQFVLNYQLVDEFGHPVDCDEPRCYKCTHQKEAKHSEIKNILVDVYMPDGRFEDRKQIKEVCSRFKNYGMSEYTCKLGRVYRGQPRIVVRFSN